MTTDELEQMLAEKSLDFTRWRLNHVIISQVRRSSPTELGINAHLSGVDGFSELCYYK